MSQTDSGNMQSGSSDKFKCVDESCQSPDFRLQYDSKIPCLILKMVTVLRSGPFHW